MFPSRLAIDKSVVRAPLARSTLDSTANFSWFIFDFFDSFTIYTTNPQLFLLLLQLNNYDLDMGITRYNLDLTTCIYSIKLALRYEDPHVTFEI